MSNPCSDQTPVSLVSSFLDLQAAMDEQGEESEDDEEVGDMAAFLVSDEEDADELPRHPPLLPASADDDIDWEAAARIYDIDWEAAAARFYRSSHITALYASIGDDLSRYPAPKDPYLLVVRCRRGTELQAIFTLMADQLDRDDPSILSAFTLPSLPNRIIIECTNPSNFLRHCSEISQLRVHRGILPVPLEDRVSLMTVHSLDRRLQCGSWVRLGFGTNKGDLGYVTRSDANCDCVRIVVVPRIDLYNPHPSKKRKRTSQRPSAKLFNATDVIHYYGRDAILTRNGCEVFQKQKYYKGLLVLDLFSTHALKKVLDPKLQEVKPFVEAGVISPREGLAITAHEANASLLPGDAVKITSGEHAGCKGILTDADGRIAFIDLDETDCKGNALPKLDYMLQVPIKAIQRIFRIGDNVRVRAEADGSAVGPAGCITEVGDGLLSIVDDTTKKPVVVLAISVESYQPKYAWGQAPQLAGTQPRSALNPLVGRFVLVGGRGFFKGYVGYARSLTDKVVHVELEANHYVVPIAISDVIDFTSGKTLDGHVLSSEHRVAFAKALRVRFAPVERSVTPPPDLPEPLNLTGEAYFEASATPGYPWVYDVEDRLAKYSTEKPYDGPGAWLLDRRVTSFYENEPIQVSFAPHYDGGRHSGRMARTQKSWLVVDPPGLHEVALVWTDNRTRVQSGNVHVSYLGPGRPVVGRTALVIAGDRCGQAVYVLRRKRGATKQVVVRCDGTASLTAASRESDMVYSEADLCRIAED